ncbi:MAG: transporter [Burkholderiales bacterium RIFCSPLOWO2_12_FULL_61_40]|nr:MAG: transporter [Burkholderiales bacterium RIFCSPLOWO2_12_FULL_61_40]
MKKLPALCKSLALCLASAPLLSALAQNIEPQKLSFDAAWNRVKDTSEKLAAAQAAMDHKTLQGEGLQGLGGPSVSVSGAAFAYSAHLDVSLDPINQRLTQISQQLPVPLENLPIPLPVPQFPAMYSYKKEDTAATASVSTVWPIYLGGATDAVRGLVGAQADEALADVQRTSHELATQLAQRYFGAQLAAKAASLREAAVRNVERHDQAAEKMLAAGVLSRVERLQVRAAFEDARRNALKARDDAELASVALARTVHTDGTVAPQTALFVLTQPLQGLPYFTEAALNHHPGLAKVAAKKAQAQRLHEGEEAARKPQVFAFGQHQIKDKNPDWAAGIGAKWTLFDSLGRDKLSAASEQQIRQAEHMDLQARSDIALLVERNWKVLEQARRQFLSVQTAVDLAQELLRLRTAGLKQGTSTTLELMDAETNSAKVQTERAQAAYEYTVALAHLLESCGLSEEYGAYVARADVWVQ